MSFCPQCGAALKAGARFCVKCGMHLAPAPPAHAPESSHQPSGLASFPPTPAVARLSLSDVFKRVQDKHKALVVALMVLMTASIACFSYSNIRKATLDNPIQYEITSSGSFLSTERSISRFDSTGNLAWKVEEAGGKPLDGMLDFDISPGGYIYAANTSRRRVEVFDPNGAWQFGFGEKYLGQDFTLKVLADGNVLVADTSSDNLKLFDPNGQFITIKGGKYEDKLFAFPNGVDQLPDGTVIIAETNNLRFQRFDPGLKAAVPPKWPMKPAVATPEGKSIFSFSNWQYGAWPTRITVDSFRNLIYVAFADDFDTPDGYLAVFGIDGSYKGRAQLKLDGGKHIDARKMRMTHDGKMSFVDIDECFAGTWDPDTNQVAPARETLITREMSRLAGAAKTNRIFGTAGRYAFLASIIGLLCFVGYSVIIWDGIRYTYVPAEQPGAHDPHTHARDAEHLNTLPAVLLSILLPGLGQIYLKRFISGAAFFSISVIIILPLYGAYKHFYTLGALPVIPIPLSAILLTVLSLVYSLSVIHVLIITNKAWTKSTYG